MLATKHGSLLAVGAMLALLPLSTPARAGELTLDDSCSRADAHATQPQDDSPTQLETAEAALAFEAMRPLPGIDAVPSDDAPPPGIAMLATMAAGPLAAAHGSDGIHGRAEWQRPPESTAPGMLDAPGDAAAHEDELAAAPLAFRDSNAPREKARDLRRWRELKLLRLLDTQELMVWLGLDRKGRPGLHFRQRNPGEAMPPPAQAAFLADPPPLRAVPLTSP